MRGIFCRGLRLELVAGIGIALGMPALVLAAQDSQNPESRAFGTQTSLTAQTRDQGGRTQATLFVSVIGEDGLPATGGVAISDRGTELAGASLNAKGEATVLVALPAGDHSLSATYAGDATHRPSVSPVAEAQAQVSGTPNFTIAVSPSTLSLKAGPIRNDHRFYYAAEQLRVDGAHVHHHVLLGTS